ncbi:LysM peptidoglycan-binding domain-containing protein [Rubrimonas cliftonensis]|uniref:LysM domain-containing protein n=1 Tax=Rubrimonas cliftonensis TaxID=89524 RepID=A0A1H4DPT6_9RHOB|nr:LysM peptidoglycan-binding domain-containing protein [Rubrimonas cliftonensis]SEA74212.1 LysM domain-containing protein [Rubrimonas cliftonensis]
MAWAKTALGAFVALALGAGLLLLAPERPLDIGPAPAPQRATVMPEPAALEPLAAASSAPQDAESPAAPPAADARAPVAAAARTRETGSTAETVALALTGAPDRSLAPPETAEPAAEPDGRPEERVETAVAGPQAGPPTAPDPEAEGGAEPLAGGAGDAEAEFPDAAATPRFDVVRVEPDGSALFAGVAEAGAEVEILIDGAVVARAQAGEDGGFVAFGQASKGAALQRLDIAATAPQAPGAAGDGGGRVTGAPAFLAPAVGTDADAEPGLGRPTIVQPTAQGVAVLQAPERPTDEIVTLDVVTYAEDGSVQLGGRGEALRPLRVFANALMVAETQVATDGRWTARSRVSLAPGAYTLRVEALSKEGRVEFVVESPFRREAVTAGPGPGEIIVQPGDTLWALAQNVYGAGPRYTVIYGANAGRIRDPDLIYPGQVLAIPDRTP